AAALAGVFEAINASIVRPPPPEPEPAPAPVEAAEPPPPPQPIVIEVPARGEPMQREERIRSIVILGAAVVLIGALVAVIILLVRRGREDLKAAASDQYVAEAYLNDLHGTTGQ